MMFELDPYIGISCLWGEPSKVVGPPAHTARHPHNGTASFEVVSHYTYSTLRFTSWGFTILFPVPTLLPITQPLFPFSSLPVLLLLVNSLNPKNSPVKEALETLNPKTWIFFFNLYKGFFMGKKTLIHPWRGLFFCNRQIFILSSSR